MLNFIFLQLLKAYEMCLREKQWQMGCLIFRKSGLVINKCALNWKHIDNEVNEVILHIENIEGLMTVTFTISIQ